MFASPRVPAISPLITTRQANVLFFFFSRVTSIINLRRTFKQGAGRLPPRQLKLPSPCRAFIPSQGIKKIPEPQEFPPRARSCPPHRSLSAPKTLRQSSGDKPSQGTCTREVGDSKGRGTNALVARRGAGGGINQPGFGEIWGGEVQPPHPQALLSATRGWLREIPALQHLLHAPGGLETSLQKPAAVFHALLPWHGTQPTRASSSDEKSNGRKPSRIKSASPDPTSSRETRRQGAALPYLSQQDPAAPHQML